MYMVGAGFRLQYDYILPSAQGTQHLPYFVLYPPVHHKPSVLRCEHYVVFAIPFRMGQTLTIRIDLLSSVQFPRYTSIVGQFLFLCKAKDLWNSRNIQEFSFPRKAEAVTLPPDSDYGKQVIAQDFFHPEGSRRHSLSLSHCHPLLV